MFSYSLKILLKFLNPYVKEMCLYDGGDLMSCYMVSLRDGPYLYQSPSVEDIISSIRINQEGQVRRICHEEEIDVLDYQILTREIIPTLKPLEEIIQENVFCLGGNRDHVPACLCFMLYCVVHSERFNLAYFWQKNGGVTKASRLIYLCKIKEKKGSWQSRVVIPLLPSSASIEPFISYQDDIDDGD
ncbi:hypothetical protein Tco_0478684 [Tanacetum coccineum]